MPKKKGFAARTKKQRRIVSAQGGLASVASPNHRQLDSISASRAAQVRWAKVRKERADAASSQDHRSQEVGRQPQN